MPRKSAPEFHPRQPVPHVTELAGEFDSVLSAWMSISAMPSTPDDRFLRGAERLSSRLGLTTCSAKSFLEVTKMDWKKARELVNGRSHGLLQFTSAFNTGKIFLGNRNPSDST